MESLNLSGKDFCQKIGISYSGDILKEFREYKLVSFFKIGKKYMYASEDADNISKKLRTGDISIKTDKGYYLTFPRSSKS